jgi:probable HAF family extracellular repeat protein
MNPLRRLLSAHRRRRPVSRNRTRLRCHPLEDRTVPASFQGLGFLPGGTSSGAADVSTDGSVVVGGAFRWTAATGMVNLGLLPGAGYAVAQGVSADGSVVVGYCFGYNTVGLTRAFRWTATTGMVDLGSLPGTTIAFARDVSADGSVVVGTSGNGAFRWTAATGMVNLGLPLGLNPPEAYGVSADGSVVVGYYSSYNYLAFRWTAATGPVLLGTAPGTTNSDGISVSADGSVLVGECSPDSFAGGPYQAVRWTAATGMVSLGFLPGGMNSVARDVSADGAVVVGDSNDSNGNDRAFRWTAAGGMRDLQNDLVNVYGLGSQLAGWTLESATCESADGRVIAGQGVDPAGNLEAWIARLDAPPAVAGVQVNDGSAQRSEVKSIAVTFSGPVTFSGGNANAAAAFQLNHVQTGGNVILSAAVATDAQGRTVVTLGFAGAETDPVSARNGGIPSLADGRYTLTVFGAAVTGAGGLALAGGGPNGNYVSPADTYGGTGLHLYRLFGDASGDGVVDATDLGQLRSTFNANSSLASYLAFLDADNSGAVDASDLGQFRARFNVNVF